MHLFVRRRGAFIFVIMSCAGTYYEWIPGTLPPLTTIVQCLDVLLDALQQACSLASAARNRP